MYRLGYNAINIFVIPFFILTMNIEEGAAEFDLVKDFTALLILTELDNILLTPI